MKTTRAGLAAMILAIVLAAGLAGARARAQDLALTGLAGEAVSLTPAQIAALPHVTLTVQVEGKTTTFQGVPLTALLARLDAPTGKALKGKDLADVVIISARDGYTVALALAETEPLMRKDQIILADSADGQPLADAMGPYRLVVEGDQRAARSERMVAAIALRRLGAASGGGPQP